MKRRFFLAGMFAAPVAAKMAPIPVFEAPLTPLAAFEAELLAPATAAIGNQFLTADVIAKEALRLLQNNLVYQRLQAGTLDPVDDDYSDDDYDDE